MKAEFSQRRMHEKLHERNHEKMEMEDPDLVLSLFYIWQFPDSCGHILKGKRIFSYKDTKLLSGAGIDAWWLTEHLVRKAAHFTEYAGLGFLLAMNTGAGIAPVFCHLKQNLTAAIFMPFIDETIQLFVEGRSGQISDVWLDMAGIFAGGMATVCLAKIVRIILKNGRFPQDQSGYSRNRRRNDEL